MQFKIRWRVQAKPIHDMVAHNWLRYFSAIPRAAWKLIFTRSEGTEGHLRVTKSRDTQHADVRARQGYSCTEEWKWNRRRTSIRAVNKSKGDALVGRLGAVRAVAEREAREELVLELHIRLRPETEQEDQPWRVKVRVTDSASAGRVEAGSETRC